MPLRFPRPIAALIAIGTAAVMVGLSAVPASADQVRQQEWWLSALSVTSAWTASRGAGVTVAVLSDGVSASQPDLAGAVTAAPALPGGPDATGQFFGELGTPIASLIAGHGHGSGGSSGIVGVAPAAHILSVPVTLPPDDAQLYQTSVAAAIPSAIAAGIRYAVGHGASVIDLPIDPGQPGSNGSGGAVAAAGGSAAERSAVGYALQHNVVLVAPAGDDALYSDAPNYPAAYPGVIAVGAFDSAIVKAPWTSRQSYVTLTAAGAGVVAASGSGGYETMNSTSAASAVVAGIVALIRSRYPGLSVADVRAALITTAMYHRANGLTDGSGYGAVDAAAALGAAATLATPAKDRAGAGAQPPVILGPAAAGTGAPNLGAEITRAGEVSAGVLGLLLLAVAGYALIRRRRTGPLPTLAAEWVAGQVQSRYPHAVVTLTEADRMLDYFAAPTPMPDQPGGHLAIPARRVTAAPQGTPADEGGAVFAAPAATSDVSRLTSYTLGSGAVAKRAAVSGTPPWEPATPPDGALPWSDTPAKQDPEPRATPRVSPGTDERPAAQGRPDVTIPAAQGRPDVTIPAIWRGSIAGGSPLGWEPAATAADRPGSGDTSRPAEADTASPGLHPSDQHRSGLPIRQPRSVTDPALSPTGSLWEPAAGGGSLWERAEPPSEAGAADHRPGTDARPMFTWEPPGITADSQSGRTAD